MKKWICLLLALVCLCGIAVSASAEKGFETLYELFIDEEVFDEPDSVGKGERSRSASRCSSSIPNTTSRTSC